jgi:ubiquinone/menaquinone biosynthesis C-methylase UbiE
MSDILGWIAAGLALGLIGVLAWWLLIASEGVYLGRRVVIWLYDLYAHRYEDVKGYLPEYEQLFLAEPLMDAIAPETAPLVLDVATGTGRLPLALARHPDFDGHTIGADLSRQMLHHATRAIYPYDHRVTFICCPAEHLPFPDDTFDIVTCMEALEFMSNPSAVLCELARVLRPGGVLLTTQRINTRLMPGKTWSAGEMLEQLQRCGIESVQAQVWQVDYRKVWGRKRGDSPFAGVRPLAAILRCPHCGQQRFRSQHKDERSSNWLCEKCGRQALVGADGVIDLTPLYRGH